MFHSLECINKEKLKIDSFSGKVLKVGNWNDKDSEEAKNHAKSC